MTARQRFLATMRYQAHDRSPLGEMGYWDETLERWRREGMEGGPDEFFCHDFVREVVPVDQGLVPLFPDETLEETAEHRVTRRSDRTVVRERKDGTCMPQWLEYPLKSRRDWEEWFLPRLDVASPGRYPVDWGDRLPAWRTRTTPLGMRLGSIYGMLRNWMGLEGISLAVYDDPVWVEEMMRHMAEFACGCGERALQDLDLDYVLTWEDMAGKNGLFLSPKLCRQLILDPYKRLTGFIKDHGVDLIFADSDGMIDDLLPIWIEGGVTGIYPLERAAGMDPLSVRQKYGPELRIIGGVDKRALAVGGGAIDEQIAHVRPLLQEGGYVAWCDHFVPPDVSLENYRRYKDGVRNIRADRH